MAVITDRVTGDPATALAKAADAAEQLVLGSHRLGGLCGYFVGSGGLNVIAHVARPVAPVRAGEQAAAEHRATPADGPSSAAPFSSVVVGLDTGDADETLPGFAFDAAARRGAALRVVHGWTEPSGDLRRFHGVEPHALLARRQATALTDALRPWRRKFPGVEVIEASHCGSAAQVLVNASRDASLAVVGRRIRTGPLGTHIGHVTHAVLHHVVAPVAVVAHERRGTSTTASTAGSGRMECAVVVGATEPSQERRGGGRRNSRLAELHGARAGCRSVWWTVRWSAAGPSAVSLATLSPRGSVTRTRTDATRAARSSGIVRVIDAPSTVPAAGAEGLPVCWATTGRG
ncbi:universal stress protein [Streptomyces sp. NPDC091215]|uniref:universal stress protein n=1 Tax=Streptomyces sp. NPDC091215 TaxID=3155192 RepID=UPI00343011B2